MKKLYLDIETYGEVSLKTHGTFRYAETAEIIMWQYAIDDGPVIVEDSLTGDLRSLLQDSHYEVVIHNSQFDRTVIRYATGINIPTDRIFDTMACALAHSLPGSLDALCEGLGVASDKAKDKIGKRLISVFCSPRKSKSGITRTYPNDKPAEWELFREYGRLDVEAMREVYRLLPKWNFTEYERNVWKMDQEINEEGISVDLDFAEGAVRAAKRALAEYSRKTRELTDGEVASTNQAKKVLAFLSETYNVDIPDLKASTVSGLIDAGVLPRAVLDILEVRLEASKTSVSKYRTVVRAVNADGKLRGTSQYCGASRTGRWAGRLFQHQNLPRPSVVNDLLEKYILEMKHNAEGLI